MGKFWNTISYLGVTQEMGFENARRIILLNRLAIALFLIVFTMRTLVTILGFQEFSIKAIIPFIAILSILTIPLYNKKGWYKYNSFIFCLIAPICALFFSVNSQTANEIININHYYFPRILIMALLVLPLVLIDSRNKVLLYIALAVNISCNLGFDHAVEFVGIPFKPELVDFTGYNNISKMMILPTGLIILAFLFLTNLNRRYEAQIIGLNDDLKNKNSDLEQYNEEVITQRDMITQKSEMLEEAKQEIESINKDLTDSIIYAERIQKAVLSKEQLPDEYFKESFIFLKAKSHVSGDFYFHKELTLHDKKALIVTAVDCTGHGVPGGFLSMLGMAMLNEIIQNEVINNAADILNHLRERIKSTLNQTGKQFEQKDGMDMALCIFFPETKELDFAGARNPLYIIDKHKTLRVIKGDRQPIGIYEKEESFTNHHLQLKEGEMLYLFSDGLQDQFGGAKGKKLKVHKLKDLLINISQTPVDKQKQQLELYIHDWTHLGDLFVYEQVDDIVMIGMRV